MPSDQDETPPEGTAIDEEERPTDPAIPTVACPECQGKGKYMVLVRETIGVDGKATRYWAMRRCMFCKWTGLVDRHRFTEWHAHRMGR